MTVGEQIKNHREKKGISQMRLSELSGVPQSTISTIEIKTKAPDIYILNKLADALNITVNDLLSNKQEAQ